MGTNGSRNGQGKVTNADEAEKSTQLKSARAIRAQKAANRRLEAAERNSKLKTLSFTSKEFRDLVSLSGFEQRLLHTCYPQRKESSAGKPDQGLRVQPRILTNSQAHVGKWIGEQARKGKDGVSELKQLPQRISDARMKDTLKRVANLALRAAKPGLTPRQSLRDMPFQMIKMQIEMMPKSFVIDDSTLRKALKQIGVIRKKGRPKKGSNC